MSDSLKLEMTGDDVGRLTSALKLCPVEKVTGVSWVQNSLVMEWEHDDKAPPKMAFSPYLMVDVVMEWLGRSKGTSSAYAAPTWPEAPNIDGDVRRGWRVESDNRRITIHPHWMIYHK